MYETVDEILATDASSFIAPTGPDILNRTQPFTDWTDARRLHGLWPYERKSSGPVGPQAPLSDCVDTISFGYQDYLSLSRHPRVHDAARSAIDAWGVHSASSPFWVGQSMLSNKLQSELSDLLGMKHIVLFPTGWAASHATITALIRPWDHVVYDRLSHSSLQAGIHAATQNAHGFRHNNVDQAREVISDIRAKDAQCGILCVTESTFSLDADYPDLARLDEVCQEYGATLLVDSAHDLGSTGPDGTGIVGQYGLRGRIGLQVGAFSKVFAFNGGFLATNSESVANYVRMAGSTFMFSNAPSPLACAVIRTSLEIVRSPEGEERRRSLMRNVLHMRAGFAAHGIPLRGVPSPLVAVQVDSVRAGLDVSTELSRKGIIANLVEFPAVPRGTARFRFQLQSDHTEEQIDYATEVFATALQNADLLPIELDLREAPETDMQPRVLENQ